MGKLRDSEEYLQKTEQFYENQKHGLDTRYNDLLYEHAHAELKYKDTLTTLHLELDVAHEKIQKQNDDLERFMCIICVTNDRNVVPPCGHASMCKECASIARPRMCPICRAAYRTSSLRPMYLS